MAYAAVDTWLTGQAHLQSLVAPDDTALQQLHLRQAALRNIAARDLPPNVVETGAMVSGIIDHLWTANVTAIRDGLEKMQ